MGSKIPDLVPECCIPHLRCVHRGVADPTIHSQFATVLIDTGPCPLYIHSTVIDNLIALSATAFENLIYDLVVLLGLENCVWRTPGRDGGRDIEGFFPTIELSGYRSTQKWYVECKKYASTVDWPTVYEKLTYAVSNKADVLLMVTSSSLSPQAIDEVNKWNVDRHPRIRFWNGFDLERLIGTQPILLSKYSLATRNVSYQTTSILPASLLALKFTRAAYAASVFDQDGQSALEAAAALADLLLSRLTQSEKALAWGVEPFRASDLYPWIEVADSACLIPFDRRSLSALFCVLRAMLMTSRLTLVATAEGVSVQTERILGERQVSDLSQIALLGNFEMNHSAEVILLRARTIQ